MTDTISTDEIDKSILEFDPFEGDFGVPGDTVVSNKMVLSIKTRPCSHCGTAIEKGERIRSQTSKFDGQFITHGWCSKCCSAMASYWDELKNDDLDMPTYESRSKAMRGAINDTITLRKLASERVASSVAPDKTPEGYERYRKLCKEYRRVAQPSLILAMFDEIDSLRTALAQQAEQGWVSLNDGLPQPHQMVLVARGKFVTTGSYSPAFGWEWAELDGEDDDSVATHWMPIPAAPKETN